MSLSGTQEGGSLQLIDAANYSEYNTPANSQRAAQGGQVEATERTLSGERGLSASTAASPRPTRCGTAATACCWPGGPAKSRATAWSWPVPRSAPKRWRSWEHQPLHGRACHRRRAGQRTGRLCHLHVQPRPADLADRGRAAGRLHVHRPGGTAGTHRTQCGRTHHGGPGAGRAEPGADRGAQRLRHRRPAAHGRSHDHRRRPRRLRAEHRADAPHRRQPTRVSMVADLARIKDPADAAYGCAPARFVRAIRGVPPPSGGMGVRQAIGETNFEQQQILGYAPVEPDGSFKLQVPADVPLALQVVDAEGRSIQTHTNWIQVRPGERRTCDGCHSPRRGAALNSGPVVNTLPAGIKQACRRSTRAARLWPRCAPGWTQRAEICRQPGVHRHLGRHQPARRDGAAGHQPALHRQPEPGRRPGHAGTGERRHQLPRAHPAAVDPPTRPGRRAHLRGLPRRQHRARPAASWTCAARWPAPAAW
jgi:hypothetical protein